MKIISFLCLLLFACITTSLENNYQKSAKDTTHNNNKIYKIGVVLPIEHAALTQIISGLKFQLNSHLDLKFQVIVKNAQGDKNIEHAIVKQFIQQKIDFIVPIGKSTTQMVANLVKDQQIKIISLAAMLTDQEINTIPNLYVIRDEIDINKLLNIMFQLIQPLNKLTLVTSNCDKVFSDIDKVVNFAKKHNIILQRHMIKEITDMYTIANHIAQDTQAILILKDHMVVSAITPLIKASNKRKIPLITSDQSTIASGGTFALGIKEESIGTYGAILIQNLILSPNKQHSRAIDLDNLKIFYNAISLQKSNLIVKDFSQKISSSQYQAIETLADQK